MEVTEVLLPGVGIRYEFVTAEGERVGVVAHRDGGAELVVYAPSDPDEPRSLVRLDREECEAVAEILGASRVAERFADLAREIPGLRTGQTVVSAASPFAGRPLGQTRARTLTGASVVAIVRGTQVIASPGPEQVLRAGDRLVVIGTDTGIAGVEALLGG
ncbi:cation:proton antiporter regulatory subunit [Marinactinospora thermotolerans]|uniref:cation:proton antiporter regulatory subunit n=1 Tax=Marinactinospora thermotolerans TaxID=531310 RepID=UPI003D8BD8A1